MVNIEIFNLWACKAREKKIKSFISNNVAKYVELTLKVRFLQTRESDVKPLIIGKEKNSGSYTSRF